MSTMHGDPRTQPDASGNGKDIVSRGRRVVEDASHLRDSTRDFVQVLDEQTRRVVTDFPYASLLTAAGIGFILGGGLRSRLPALVLSTSARWVAGWGIRALAESASGAIEQQGRDEVETIS